ncbi:hypothetical protein [Streptomyces sp. NBC_01506]|uniref:hypothetical protein n=1 Tax=Streptomyces sp. NBC_01506 TaxID=2903887 RepID=UPI0038706132
MIEEVLTLLTPHLPRPSFWNVDWNAIEAELGHHLPTDYKRLCEHLPPGRFRDFLWLQHPLGTRGGNLLGREAELVATVREMADITCGSTGTGTSTWTMPRFPGCCIPA